MNIFDDVAAILGAGVTGFAFLMLYLGYRLMSDAQSSTSKFNPEEFHDVKIFKEWETLAYSRLKNARFFLVVSMVFFLGGLLSLGAESEIILSVTPSAEYDVAIIHQENPVHLNDAGLARLKVGDEQSIIFSNVKLIKELHRLESSAENRKKIIQESVISMAGISSDSGF